VFRKCRNVSCAKKEGCIRYTSPTFGESPGNFAPDENGNCFFFWPENKLNNIQNKDINDNLITPLYLLLLHKEE